MKIFLDDFTVSNDFSTQLEKLKKWFFKYKEFDISLNLDKCAFHGVFMNHFKFHNVRRRQSH